MKQYSVSDNVLELREQGTVVVRSPFDSCILTFADIVGLTYREIAERHPSVLAARDADKFHYRYPHGESYADLAARIQPILIELERRRNVLIIAHQAVIRCILGYFLDKKLDAIPYLEVPLHVVFRLMPLARECSLTEYRQPIGSTNTQRERPTNVSRHRSIEEALETTPGFGRVPKDSIVPPPQ